MYGVRGIGFSIYMLPAFSQLFPSVDGGGGGGGGSISKDVYFRKFRI